MQNDKKNMLVVILLAAFIDVLGFSIIIPVLPFWVTSLGGDSLMYGILLSSYSFFQFLTAPLWGRLSDKVGRKPIFMVGLFGSMSSFFLLVVVALYFNTLEALFIARVLEGLFTSATLPTAYAYISDVSSSDEKTARFAFVGAVAGLGMTLGPFLGGTFKVIGEKILTETNGYWAPALFATILATINIVLAIRNLPNSTKHQSEQKNESSSVLRIFSTSPILILAISVLAVVSLSFSSMEATLALFGMARISGFDELDTGILFLLVGSILILVQGFLIRKLAVKYTDSQLIIAGLIILGSGFALAIITTDMIVMLVIAIPISVGMALIGPSAVSLISKNIPADKQGQLMGLNESISAFMRILGPLVGTTLFTLDIIFPWIFGAMTFFILVIVFITFTIVYTKRINTYNVNTEIPSI